MDQIDSNQHSGLGGYGLGNIDDNDRNTVLEDNYKSVVDEHTQFVNGMKSKQEDFFYKIKLAGSDKNSFIIEQPQSHKKYKVQFTGQGDFGFVGLPAEWVRFISQMNYDAKEIAKEPFEALMTINFVATQGFKKMLNKSTLYDRMGKICDQIKKRDPQGDFKIIEQLGKGGFGAVYLVQHIKSKKHFAMKEIAPNDEADLEDTLTEIALQNMAAKSHKNIVSINKSYEWNANGVNKFFLVMEWMDAGDLSTMLKTIPGQFQEEVIVYIIREILQALYHMHQNNQIHRDLKPLNVMLSTDGGIKLGDFGLAAQLVQDEYYQKEIKGTPKWMAPEILMTKPYNELVDIWSLGIIAYELAIGTNPYQGMNLNRIMFAAKNQKSPKIEDNMNGKFSAEFIDFVNNKCLVKNVDKRADATDLLAHPLFTRLYPDQDDLFDYYLVHLTNYMNTPKFKQKMKN